MQSPCARCETCVFKEQKETSVAGALTKIPSLHLTSQTLKAKLEARALPEEQGALISGPLRIVPHWPMRPSAEAFIVWLGLGVDMCLS